MADRPADVAILSLATTLGLRRADSALARQIRAAGASCEVVEVRLGPARHLRHAMAVTDLVEASAARRGARALRARAVIASSATAALLLPRLGVPLAVRFDSPAALNRPGAGGAWQRRRERAVLARADLLLPWSEAAARSVSSPAPVLVLPPPVEEGAPRHGDGPAALAYAANPDKRGLALLCAAWSQAAPAGTPLTVAGLEPGEARRRLGRAGVPEPPGTVWLPAMRHERWRELMAGAGIFISAARFEDWGIAQMEALAAGTPLVTVPSEGANAALPLARELAPELVAAQRTPAALAGAIRAGLALDEDERGAYAARAGGLLAPYREQSLVAAVERELLPRLLGSSA